MYRIVLSRQAEKTLKQLPDSILPRILERLQDLADNPKTHGAVKLKDRDAWRLRIRDYRVIYKVLRQELVIIVIKIGHRRDVYRD